MESFEDKLKDRFNNASSLEGINANELWNSIEPVITDQSRKKKPFFYRYRIFLLLLLCVTSIGILTWYQTSQPSTSISQSREEEKTISNPPKPSTDNATANAIQKPEANAKIKTNTSPSIIPNSQVEIDIETPHDLNQIHISSSPVAAKQSKNQMVADENTNQLLPSQKITSVENPLPQRQLSSNNQILTKIETLRPSLIRPSLVLNQLEEKAKNEAEDKDENEVKIKKSSILLRAYLGGHTTSTKFSPLAQADEERSSLLNNSYQQELGYSFALEADYRFHKNLFITSGLEYNHSRTEFNFIQDWDTTIINPSSPVGATTRAIATRTVRHHNKTTSLVLPIMLGFQNSKGRLAYGASIGIGLNFLQSQTGKTLNLTEQIVTYPSSENDLLPFPKFFLSYQLKPFLNLKLDQEISFQLRADIRLQNFGNSNFHQLDYSSILIGGGIGFQYKLAAK